MARAFDTAAVLAAWEAGRGRPPVQRALALLALAGPELASGDPAQLPIGERDRRLLALREELFGSALEATEACPRCGERVELGFRVEQARAQQGTPIDQGSRRLQAGPFEVRWRLPTSADLLAVGASAGGRETLLRRCVEEVRQGGAAVEGALPDAVAEAVAKAMSEADPQADVQVSLDCPSCGHPWQATFDVVAWLWTEIEDWARRLVREVHALASAYGWTEQEVLALSPWRRSLYLELSGG